MKHPHNTKTSLPATFRDLGILLVLAVLVLSIRVGPGEPVAPLEIDEPVGEELAEVLPWTGSVTHAGESVEAIQEPPGRAVLVEVETEVAGVPLLLVVTEEFPPAHEHAGPCAERASRLSS